MIHPLFFAFISFFSWAVGDIFGVVAVRKLGSFSTTAWGLLLRFVIFSLYLPFAVSNLKELTFDLFVVIVLITIVGLVGFIAFNEGMKVGNPALIGTIAAGFPFVTVILSTLFLRETLSFQQIIAIGLIFIGIMLSSFDWQLLKKSRTLQKGVNFALITLLCWGIWFAFLKIPVQKIGWFLPNYAVYISFPFVFLFMKMKKIKLIPLTKENGAIPLIIAVLFLATAELSYSLGITNANSSIIAPIAGSYPALFVILAFFIFKEPIKKQQIIGIITTLAGIVFLSMVS